MRGRSERLQLVSGDLRYCEWVNHVASKCENEVMEARRRCEVRGAEDRARSRSREGAEDSPEQWKGEHGQLVSSCRDR